MYGLDRQLGYYVNVMDSEAHLWMTDGKYKKALEYFKMLYKEGLVDQEIFTQTDKLYFRQAGGWENRIHTSLPAKKRGPVCSGV